jgi:ATP-dependent DNA helicase RecG
LFANVQADRTAERLKALEENSDGFALAEQDLAIRGPGALIGSDQSGLADIAMAALENLPLVQAASEAANKILDDDPQLENHPQVAARISRLQELAHFE